VGRGEAPAGPRVAHLDRRAANAIEVGEDRYMFLDGTEPGAAPALVPARCPHRGGPLHFAAVEQRASGAVLICPWHGSAIPLRALRRRAVAMVQSGHQVRAVIDAPAGVTPIVRHIPIRFAPDGACAGDCAGAAGEEALTS
jgi:nitrite reductase/ring-hydroxylating ferredoxin subunit